MTFVFVTLMRDWQDIKLDVLSRLDMRQVAEMCGIMGRKQGTAYVACCPFHAEKHGSFNIGGKKGMEHRAHCFGCGWDGDIFSFWQELKGSDFKQTLLDLAAVAGVPTGGAVEWTMPEVPKVRTLEKRLVGEDEHEKPSLPSLRHLRREECDQVAKARGLNPEAIWMAARVFKRMAFSEWPLYFRHGEWLHRSVGAWPSWAAIDETKNVAEFRRLDNGKYPRQDGGEIKTWSTAGKAWPLGAAAMNGRPCVLLVEGGPDMLAAYHFLLHFRMLERVAVVCMLGASNKIRSDALPFFKGKRVRIMADADALKDDENPKKRRVPGMQAAARWAGQLTEAGAAVETFNLGPVYDSGSLLKWAAGDIKAAEVTVMMPGFEMPDGTPVKDLNDLAKCSASVLGMADVRDAFRLWDF